MPADKSASLLRVVCDLRGIVEDSASVRHDEHMAGRIYSIGYEGWTLPHFVESLTHFGVGKVFDVRLTPMSRKPGFSRRALCEALAEAGIEYIHEPELGNPRENRQHFQSGDVQQGYRVMRELLDNGSGEALHRVVQAASDGSVAVLCVERSAINCHRHVITDAATEMAPSIEVVAVN